jgi:hypothetical protein
LRAGAVESADAAERVARMGETFTVIDRNAAKWRDGVRPADPMAERRGVVVRQGTGVAVDIPFIGVRVGRPDVIVEEDAQPQMERRRYHPNARGSKRALERELAGVKTALSYLTEDTGVVSGPAPSPNAAPPTPQPPDETRTGPALRPPQKITPSGARKSTPEPARS